MTTSTAQISSRWSAGRIAAAFLFVVGAAWTVTFARGSEFPKLYPPGYLVLPGYVVWVLWGLRAVGISHPRFRSVTWCISTLWHLVWFLLSLWLLPGLFFFGIALWTIPMQMGWTVIAFMTSLFIWRGDPRKQ